MSIKKSQDLNKNIELIKNTPSDALIRSHLKVVFTTYQSLFGEVCSGCPTLIAGYIKKIKNYNVMKVSSKNSNRKFNLKEGVVIPVPGTSTAYTSHNITDQVALELLRANPNRKQLFSKMPDDVDSLIRAEAPRIKSEEKVSEDSGLGQVTENLVTIGEKKLQLENALILLEEAGIKTKATTVSGVQKKIDSLSEETLESLHKLLEVSQGEQDEEE